ncbi:PadR family transcriptional regulator [Leucobacter sp. G161]|uniref:PadR family transcriptional regulator n=1 Tax=Leucobacter sp. G161 TaxID=663704 RepID=UPI0009F89AD8|nr:PadR family transcriptional regulator [Leucobacter sp. G161]
MSVKHAMLALLAAEPSSTYQLRKRFDATTGQGLPLNIGQVSSTLQRLERDGMAERPADGQLWQLLPAGREELALWWASPVLAEQRGRDELVLKLALAAVTPGVDVSELLQTQRAATQRAMHDLTRVRRSIAADEVVARLVVDHHIFQAEAELRWIDDAEATLLRAANRAPSGSRTGQQGPGTSAQHAGGEHEADPQERAQRAATGSEGAR